jgi:hypothetical protein
LSGLLELLRRHGQLEKTCRLSVTARDHWVESASWWMSGPDDPLYRLADSVCCIETKSIQEGNGSLLLRPQDNRTGSGIRRIIPFGRIRMIHVASHSELFADVVDSWIEQSLTPLHSLVESTRSFYEDKRAKQDFVVTVIDSVVRRGFPPDSKDRNGRTARASSPPELLQSLKALGI